MTNSSEEVKRIYFFDIDDTLLQTHKFNDAAVAYSLEGLVEREVGVSFDEALDFYKQVYDQIKASDNQMFLYGLLFCDRNPQFFENELKSEDLARTLNDRFHYFMSNNMKNFLASGARESLEKLVSKGFKLGVISQGSPSLQSRKFDMLRVKGFFDSHLMFFYEEKNVDNYNKIREIVSDSFSDYELFMVGDRPDKDCEMPLQAGFTPIRIVGDSKYSKIPTPNGVENYKNLDEFYSSLN